MWSLFNVVSFTYIFNNFFFFIFFMFWHHPRKKPSTNFKKKILFPGHQNQFHHKFSSFLGIHENEQISFFSKNKKESYKTSKFTAWENNIYSHIHSYYNFIYDNILTVKIFMLNRKEKNIFFLFIFGGYKFPYAIIIFSLM